MTENKCTAKEIKTFNRLKTEINEKQALNKPVPSKKLDKMLKLADKCNLSIVK